jgi:hypothetical protein
VAADLADSAHAKAADAAHAADANAKTTQQKAKEALGSAQNYAAATFDSVTKTAGSYAALAKDKLLGEETGLPYKICW